MTNKNIPHIDHTGTLIIPYLMLTLNITTGMAVSLCLIP